MVLNVLIYSLQCFFPFFSHIFLITIVVGFFSGQVTIEFHVEKETNFIVLHTQDLNVTEKVKKEEKIDCVFTAFLFMIFFCCYDFTFVMLLIFRLGWN